MSGSEVLEELFPKTANVLAKDGEINDEVQGTYHYYDYSKRITNDRCNNIIDNTLNNVSNTSPQVKYHETGARSTHHGRFATSTVATVDGSAINNHASSPYHNPQSQVSIRNNPGPLSYGSVSPQSSGQYISARPGNIREMSAGRFAFMSNKMKRMKQEMKHHFDGDTSNEQQNTVGPDMSNESSRHINIPGNHTEVDNKRYQSDFDSNIVQDNNIKNSFGKGEQGDNNYKQRDGS